MEKEHIERVLAIFKGNRTKSAQAIGWSYNTLNNKVKKYKLGYLIKGKILKVKILYFHYIIGL